MSDQPLTVAELESLAIKADRHAAADAPECLFVDWPGTLAQVCRQAIAQAKELERLRKVLASIDRDVTEELARPDCTNVLTLHLVQTDARVALASREE